MRFENVNWEAVSAVSNITLSFLTFLGLMLTMYFNTRKYKLSIEFKIDNKWRMKVINKRSIPVHLTAMGFMAKTKEGRELILSDSNSSTKKRHIEWNDAQSIEVGEGEIHKKLLKVDYKENEKVWIYAFAITRDGRKFKKKVKKLVLRTRAEEPKLKLNK